MFQFRFHNFDRPSRYLILQLSNLYTLYVYTFLLSPIKISPLSIITSQITYKQVLIGNQSRRLVLYNFYSHASPSPPPRCVINVLVDIRIVYQIFIGRQSISRISIKHVPHKCLATNARSFNEILAPRKFIYRLLGYHLIGFSIIDTPIIEITRGELNHGCVRPRSIHAIRTRTCNLQVSIETNGNVCVTCVPVCHVHNSWPHRNFHKNLTFLF